MGALETGGRGERKHIHPKKAPIRHPFPIEWAANIGPLDIGAEETPWRHFRGNPSETASNNCLSAGRGVGVVFPSLPFTAS